MAGIALRDATPRDAAAVAEIWTHYVRETAATFTTEAKTEASVARLIAGRQAAGHAFIVAVGSTVLGFATYAPFRSGPGYARTMEHTVMLARGTEGQGTGRALLTAIEAHARAAGHHSMIAGISSGNPGACAFHRRLGYRDAGLLPEAGWKMGRWWDLHLLQKML